MTENDLTPIEKLALLARQSGLDEEPQLPRLRMISFRLPIALLASIEAFASITSQSRNSTMIDLLEAGIFAVFNALDDPEQFHAARENFLDQFNSGE